MRVLRWAIGFACIVGAAATAAAQDSVTLDRFSASATPSDDFQIDRPITPEHLRFGAMLHLDYGLDPLVYTGSEPGGMEESATVVSQQMNANVAFSLGLGERWMVYAGLPVVLLMDGDDNPTIGSTPIAAADGPGLGDAYFGGRVRIFGNEQSLFTLGAQATVTVPSAGSDQRFRGDNLPTGVPEVLLALHPWRDMRLTMNLGGVVRKKSDDANSNLTFGSEFTYALGWALPVWHGLHVARHLDAHVQAFGTTNFKSVEETPMEVVGGLKFFHESGFIVGAVAGPGITRGFGTPVVRGVLMLGYQQPVDHDRDGDGLVDADDRCPDDAEDRDGFEDEDGCPDPDNDQDGILDGSDRCPNDPEVVNGVDDDDGCPDEVGDRDGDGIKDDVDACPDDREDIDGFEDVEGCPDPDNDQDGVLDLDDSCPIEAGEVSNFGCPDPDRDGDGVPDRIDNCPDEPGLVERQGCKARQKVRIESSALVIDDRIYFQTRKSRIQRRSHALLNDVAQVLIAHPEIEHVVVEGHTDKRGGRDYNKQLSQARAEAVVEYLEGRGVDASRLEARGYGQERPVVEDAQSEDDHARNRRVEFHIPTPNASATPPAAPEKL